MPVVRAIPARMWCDGQRFPTDAAVSPIKMINNVAYVPIGDKYLQAVEWDMIYNSTSASTVTNNRWYTTTAGSATTGYTTGYATGSATIKVRSTGTNMYAKCYDYTAGEAAWVQLDNGWENFAEPCSTAVVEWAWAADGEHECTVKWRSGTFRDGHIYAKPLTPEEQKIADEARVKRRLHEIIQGRCSPNIIVRQNHKRQPLAMSADIREQRARETLRRVIGDTKFVNFIKHGFISVKARSGLVYQIFTGHGITHVFNQGNLVERLCVVLQGSFPPTDSLIMRYLLILNNEQQFRSYAVKHSVEGYQTKRSRQIDGPAVMKPLAEIFKELKKVA